VDRPDAPAGRVPDNLGDRRGTEHDMTNLERWLPLHLLVVTFVVVAFGAALIVEGLGFALIVGLALVVVLAIGYPMLVILAEGRDQPIRRDRP
jgi:hypothetical protein